METGGEETKPRPHEGLWAVTVVGSNRLNTNPYQIKTQVCTLNQAQSIPNPSTPYKIKLKSGTGLKMHSIQD